MNYTYSNGSCTDLDLTTPVNQTMALTKQPLRRRPAAVAAKVLG